ncbi:hypothetical protein SAY87_026099 [Trapa incisa]|uniref:Chlororespiratory reduction 3 n=1 Tax=Trapa incisa TaxID=236973 RepID=A0AAN7GUW1_9MYRT|nr:hypothetical protein SAY87_026099 [Trapa incisa]
MNCYCSLSLSTISVVRNASVQASVADDRSLSSPHPSSSSPRRTSPPPETPIVPRPRRIRTHPGQSPKKRTGLSQPGREQPTVIQIERAIGTGVFRDNDPLDFNARRSVFDGIIPGPSRKFETTVERKLRETGEWLVSQSERRPNSAGKTVLVAMFQWLLPTWVLLLLGTSGVVKLPFDIPFLSDLTS